LRGFAQAHVLADHRVEDQVLVGLPNLGQRSLGEPRPPVEEGGQDSDSELMPDPVLEQTDRLEQPRNPVHREIARFERDDDLAGGSERVEGQDADVGGAVDQHEVVGRRELLDRVRQPLRTARGPFGGELLLERGEDYPGRSDVEVRVRLDDDLLQLRGRGVALREHLVQVLLQNLGIDPQSDRRVGLRIHVDDEDPVGFLCK
jgi:hypothetical protein